MRLSGNSLRVHRNLSGRGGLPSWASLHFAAIALILLWPWTGWAHEIGSYKIVVLERGIYEAQTDSASQAAEGVWRVHEPKLVASTVIIPMRRPLRFGFRYTLQGPPGQPVAVELITRLPAPLLRNDSKVLPSERRYRLEMRVGLLMYRDFQFVEDEELVPGIWLFEFWRSGRKLGEQRFCVVVEGAQLAVPNDLSCESRTS